MWVARRHEARLPVRLNSFQDTPFGVAEARKAAALLNKEQRKYNPAECWPEEVTKTARWCLYWEEETHNEFGEVSP
jgi:hypothetical protein